MVFCTLLATHDKQNTQMIIAVIVTVLFVFALFSVFSNEDSNLTKLNKYLKKASTEELETLKGIIDNELSKRH
jgi:hypothetical protein